MGPARRPYPDLTRVILLILLLGLICSCAPTRVKPPEGPFYVTPEVTYLLESPGYGGNVLGPLYRGDKVERLGEAESGWWQVKLLRSGQAGWVRKELLDSSPVATVFRYVNEDTLSLRECPRRDCLPLQLLYRGDQVQKIEEGDQGWWRVLVINSRSLGWVPAASLTERLEEARQGQPRKAYYYVAIMKMRLRAQPSNRSAVIRTLKFNEQVQRIGQSDDWLKVRQPASGAVGWVRTRDLETLPLIFPRGRLPAEKELKPIKQREEPLAEPELM